MVYTLGVLGAAFGISYAVFEWRDTTDYGACHKTLLDFTLTTRLVEKGELSGSAFTPRRVPEKLQRPARTFITIVLTPNPDPVPAQLFW